MTYSARIPANHKNWAAPDVMARKEFLAHLVAHNLIPEV
jgi:hypothetical protein